jgi:hypothetical protein
MSFLTTFAKHHDPVAKVAVEHDPLTRTLANAFASKKPPPPPGVPNINDAANAAQSDTDALRARRGLLANIYAGASNTQPVTGKSALGT